MADDCRPMSLSNLLICPEVSAKRITRSEFKAVIIQLSAGEKEGFRRENSVANLS